MKRGAKHTSSIYAHLEQTNVLDKGEAAIAQAKAAYWKAYKAKWRKKHRAIHTEVTLSLTKADVALLLPVAKAHKRSLSRFIKESCLAYVGKQYVVPDIAALATIRQLLAMNRDMLQLLFDDAYIPFEAGRTALAQMAKLEKEVLHELYHPQEAKPDRE